MVQGFPEGSERQGPGYEKDVHVVHHLPQMREEIREELHGNPWRNYIIWNLELGIFVLWYIQDMGNEKGEVDMISDSVDGFSDSNPIRDKSYAFALRIVKLYQYLCEEKKEFVLSKQILKSGTSIGANIEESIGASSKKDFLSKITIAYKEARETRYWLRLLRDSGYLKSHYSEQLISTCEELIKIITSIQKSIKSLIS